MWALLLTRSLDFGPERRRILRSSVVSWQGFAGHPPADLLDGVGLLRSLQPGSRRRLRNAVAMFPPLRGGGEAASCWSEARL